MFHFSVFFMTIFTLCFTVAGVVAGYFIRKKVLEGKARDADQLSKKIIEEAEKKAELLKKEALIQAKDDLYQSKAELEKETRQKMKEFQGIERSLMQRENTLDKRDELLQKKEDKLSNRERDLENKMGHVKQKETELEEQIQLQRKRLESIAGLSSEKARSMLMESLEEEAKHKAAKRIRRIEEEAKLESDKRAKKIISTAIGRFASEYVSEKTVTVVNLPSDDMKGRIIGREGRNIRAIEAATGVDLIVDDTPEAVILSGFNPIRREIARITLEKLIKDGRIHPARIEEVATRSEEEVELTVKEAGEQATFDLNIHGLHPQLIRLLGSLKFRTSYAQNVYQHSIEVGFLSGLMASELNLDMQLARRAGLLHDIGKAVDHEIEGSHAKIGADIARKFGEIPEIVHAISTHHNEPQPVTILDHLVQAADALSGARPGARLELFESYVRRLEDLENIARGFKGVEKAYAIQAGRELRVMVKNDEIDDDQAFVLCSDIAKQIEKKLTYPGQIRVTVIRELRSIGYAK